MLIIFTFTALLHTFNNTNNLKQCNMRDLVWLIVVLLIIGWLVGFFAFPDLGSLIHILLVIAVIMIIFKLVTGRKV